MRALPPLTGALLAAVLAGSGCRESALPGALLLTQTPVAATSSLPAATVLDERYPPGSRVVLLLPPYRTNDVRLLSKGLLAAGDAVVAPDGRTVYFAGRRDAAGDWQIYQARLNGGTPRRVTAMPGGALNPAVAAHDELVFASPVPPADQPWAPPQPAALHALKPGEKSPRRITFTPHSALDPTVLADGRILFVTVQPGGADPARPRLALFTVNTDGSEPTAFAGQHDGGWPLLRRPRLLDRQWVGFLAAEYPAAGDLTRAEGVRLSRPQFSRSPLLPAVNARCRAIEPGEAGEWLACLEPLGLNRRSPSDTFAVFRVRADAPDTVTPLFDDPAWHEVEAAWLAARPRPQGHKSSLDPRRATGTVLCLDVNETSFTEGPATNPAARVRFAARSQGAERVLGELQPHADGSFLVELPADVPLVIEAFDATGRLVRRCPPIFWVRPGENRGCVGCHEPHHRAPRNARPLAANRAPVSLTSPPPALAGPVP